MTEAEAQHAPVKARNNTIWMRGLIMIIMAILFGIAETVLLVIAVIQFFWTVFTGDKNSKLSDFGAALSRWFKQVADFQTMQTEERPFPWAPWPGKSIK